MFTRGIVRNRPFWVYFLIGMGVQYGVSFGFAVVTWRELQYGLRIFDTTILGTGALPIAWFTNNMEILLYGYRPFMQSSPPPDWVITLNFLLLGLPMAIVLSLVFAWYCRRRGGIGRATFVVSIVVVLINPGAFLCYRNGVQARNGYYPIAHSYPGIETAAAWGDVKAAEKMVQNAADATCMDASGHTLLFRLLHGTEVPQEPAPLDKRGFITFKEKETSDLEFGLEQGDIIPILLYHGVAFSASDLVDIRKLSPLLSDDEWNHFIHGDGGVVLTNRIALLFAVAYMGDEFDNATIVISEGVDPNFRFAFSGVGNRTLLHYAVQLDENEDTSRYRTRYLLESGVDATLKDDSNETALEMAMRIWPDRWKKDAEDWLRNGYKPEQDEE